VGSHQSGAEGQNPLPHPAGDAAQGMVGLGCECTLLGHLEFLVNQHPQFLLLRAALNPFSAQPVFVLGIALTHVQTLHLTLLNLIRFAEAHLSSLSRSLWMPSLPSSMFTASHSNNIIAMVIM